MAVFYNTTIQLYNGRKENGETQDEDNKYQGYSRMDA